VIEMKAKDLERYNAGIRRSSLCERIAFARSQHRAPDKAFNCNSTSGAFLLFRYSNSKCLVAAVSLVLFSGCAAVNNPVLSSGPHPRVEDCAMVQQATPTRYVCDGRIYTSVQLDEISKGEQVQLSEQASHGAFPGNVISPTGNFGTYPQGGAASPGPGVH
jgi:hypothetical protein